MLYFGENEKYHYCWIKNFNGFMYDITNSHYTKHFCVKCLMYFHSEDSLKLHYTDYKDCTDNQTSKVTLPSEDKAFIEFKNYNNKFEVPFRIYADTESIIKEEYKGKQEHISSGAFFILSLFMNGIHINLLHIEIHQRFTVLLKN